MPRSSTSKLSYDDCHGTPDKECSSKYRAQIVNIWLCCPANPKERSYDEGSSNHGRQHPVFFGHRTIMVLRTPMRHTQINEGGHRHGKYRPSNGPAEGDTGLLYREAVGKVLNDLVVSRCSYTKDSLSQIAKEISSKSAADLTDRPVTRWCDLLIQLVPR